MLSDLLSGVERHQFLGLFRERCGLKLLLYNELLHIGKPSEN